MQQHADQISLVTSDEITSDNRKRAEIGAEQFQIHMKPKQSERED